jgi:peptide/nickel transport system substrate-binding protein
MTRDEHHGSAARRPGAPGARFHVTRRGLLVGSAALGLSAAAMSAGIRDLGIARAAQDGGGTVQVRVNADVEVLDPAHIGNPPDHAAGVLIYSGLARYTPGTIDVVPDLATGWEISEDGLTFTFELRQGVKWHKDYGDFTAEDVVYTYNRIKDPETASRFAGDLEAVESIEAVDEYTVRFTLSEPFSAFLSAVVAFRPGWIVNQRAIEEKGEAYTLDPIGTGPYVFESRSPGTELVLTRNPEFYEPLSIETVRMKFVQEDSVAELALQAGDLDASYLYAPESSQRALDEAGDEIEAKRIAAYRTQWAGFNLSREKMQDIRVRQAIIHAIDKPAAAAAVAGDLAQVVSSIFNPNLAGYIDPNPFPYDPEKAKALLAEAGYADGIDIDVLVIPSSTWPDLATVVQEQWRQSGINANLIVVERAVYDEMIDQAEAFDVATVNITRSEPYQYASYFLSTNIPDPNFHHYDNPEVDEIIRTASRELDPARQTELWEQFQEKVLVEDVVGFGMTNVNYAIAWRNNVTNVDSMYVDSYPVWQMSIS